MKQKNSSSKETTGEPVLDFISGKTETPAARKVTKNIGSIQSLWQLAKMTRIVRESRKLN